MAKHPDPARCVGGTMDDRKGDHLLRAGRDVVPALDGCDHVVPCTSSARGMADPTDSVRRRLVGIASISFRWSRALLRISPPALL